MKKIALIGGLGYVGLHLVEYLRPLGYEMTLFGRKNLNVLADEDEQTRIKELSPENSSEKFDIVVNLAYPTSYSRKKNFHSNIEIVKFIKSISSHETLILHFSTLVVFGTALDYHLSRNKIALRRDTPYTEVKIHIENLLQRELKGHQLHIIRLGNVWGPGAPSWLHKVADRIVFEDPFPDKAMSAPSNITYVKNICDFIYYMAGMEYTGPAVNFHHFAEFGAIKWGTILNDLGQLLNEKVVYKPFRISVPGSLSQEIKEIVAPVLPRALFYKMLEMRKMASLAKSFIDMTPFRLRQNLKSFRSIAIPSRDTMDIVFSNQVLFEHSIHATWQPKFSYEEALNEIKVALSKGGYIIKDPASRS